MGLFDWLPGVTEPKTTEAGAASRAAAAAAAAKKKADEIAAKRSLLDRPDLVDEVIWNQAAMQRRKLGTGTTRASTFLGAFGPSPSARSFLGGY